MPEIQAYIMKDFIEKYQDTWMYAENKTLQPEEPIKLDEDFLYIGKYFVRSELIPKLLNEIDERISLPTDDIPADLVEHITEYFLKKSGGKVAILDNEIMSFTPKKLPYTLKELCDKVQMLTKSNYISEQSYIGDHFITIYSIDSINTREPKIDDVVCGGLAVEATISGSIKIYPFSFRMVCSNGAIHRIDDEQKNKWGFQPNGDGKDPDPWFDHIKSTYDSEMNSTLDRISSLRKKEVSIDDIGQFLRVIVGQNNLPRSVLELLTSEIRLGGPINAYDFWNLTTQAYTHLAKKNPRRGFKYFKLGGSIGDYIYKPPSTSVNCKSCGKPFGCISDIEQ